MWWGKVRDGQNGETPLSPVRDLCAVGAEVPYTGPGPFGSLMKSSWLPSSPVGPP